MERWAPDVYEVVVFHRGRLSDEEQRALDQLRALVGDQGLQVNVEFRTADISVELDEKLAGIFKGLALEGPPAVVLQYPRAKEGGKVIWTGRLIPETVTSLIDSPVRREIARRLLAGDVAVWGLVECGQQERDDEAAGILESELETMERELNRSNPAGRAVGGQAMEPGPALYSFSVIRVSRTDPAEKVLVAMLLNSEPDLHKYADQPIAFPIFGRGRILYALVGRGIVRNNIKEASYFLSGPCACEIKGESPGLDLLMAANWDKVLEQPLVVDEPLPPLTGVLPLSPKEDEGSTMATVQGETASEDFDRGIGLVGAVILVFAGIAVLVIFASRKIK